MAAAHGVLTLPRMLSTRFPLVIASAWLLTGPLARAQTTDAQAPLVPPPPPSLEERMRWLERELTELKARQALPPVSSQVPPASEKGAPPPPPAEATPYGEPFAWGDFTWLNGSTRQTERILATKYFTPQLDVDVNYTWSFNRPIDNTVVGSTALARTNELELSFLGLGGDFYANGVRARMMLQYGTRSTVVPRNDGSVLRGQFDLMTVYRYISEAYAGYHWWFIATKAARRNRNNPGIYG